MSSNKANKKRFGRPGEVFTKPEVVEFMLDEVGYVASTNLSKTSIMEPSCGEGEFVIEIVKRLKQSSILFNFDLNKAYQECVSASDIDQKKLKSAYCAYPTKFLK